MKADLDIHDYGRRLQTAIIALERPEVAPRNRQLIKEFKDSCVLEDMSLARMERYVGCLRRMAEILGKDFDRATREDITRVVRDIQMQDTSPWTKYTYKILLRRFYKWLKGDNEEYPEEVKWIKPRVKLSDTKLPNEGDLLTEEEVDNLVRVAITPRDKAFVALLYESGARIGEMGSLQIRNVKPDNYGVVLWVTGKTGQRPIRIIKATPHLMTWLACHPRKDDPEAALWVTISTAKHTPVCYAAMRNLLQRLFERAGIRKRFNPHLFRHSRATHLAEHLTEFQLNVYFGWVHGSNMAATYVHMNGKNVDAKMLELNGLAEANAPKEVKKPRSCPRCETINTVEAKYCLKCGGVLDVRTAMEIGETGTIFQERTEPDHSREEKVIRAILEKLRTGTGTNCVGVGNEA